MIRRIARLAETPLLFLTGLYVLAPMAIDALRSVRRRGGYRANLRVAEDPRVVEELAAELSKYEEFGDGPFVCPPDPGDTRQMARIPSPALRIGDPHPIAKFIAAARNALPGLLARIRELEEALAGECSTKRNLVAASNELLDRAEAAEKALAANCVAEQCRRTDAAEKRVADLDAEKRNLQRQLTVQSENNHKRNVALDALHFVWCTGGCASGVHRYDHGELTQEIVEAAIDNTKRLVSWWRNKGFKAEFKELSAENQGLWYKAVYRARELEAELAALRATPAAGVREALRSAWAVLVRAEVQEHPDFGQEATEALGEVERALAGAEAGERRVFEGPCTGGIAYEAGDSPWAEVTIEADKWVTFNVGDPMLSFHGKRVRVTAEVLPDPKEAT